MILRQPATFRFWHFVCSGFLQRSGQPNGMVALWSRLHEVCAGPDSVVELHTWDTNWDDLAERVWRLQPQDVPPVVTITGYSWGGAGAINLAKRLDDRGIQVASMVLSDPVYRHWYRCGSWRALVSWSKLRVPPNVRSVTVYAQSRPLLMLGSPWVNPRGHRVEVAEVTELRELRDRPRIHAYMDDLPEFQASAIEQAKRAMDQAAGVHRR